VDTFKFIFWEAMKGLSLALLGLLAAKAVASLGASGAGGQNRLRVVRGALYAAILTLAALGAQAVGKDLAARFYFSAAQDDLARSDAPRAYTNALRAVELRPANLLYWRLLERSKFSQQQFASMLADRPVFDSLSGGRLEEEDALRFAFAHFFLAQYDQVVPLTRQIIAENRYYGEPYVLEGFAYSGKKNYAEAERCFLGVLQLFPSTEDAVRGLASAYFSTGQRARALAVLDETQKFPFSPAARQRFQDLKEMYSE